MLSAFLLTAACVTGAAEPQTPGCNCGAAPQVVQNTDAGSFRQRLRNFFGLRQPNSPYPAVAYPAPTDQPMAYPAPTDQPVAYPAPAQPPHSYPAFGTAYQTAPPPEVAADASEASEATVPRPEFKIPEKHQNKVGHEADYAWITGHLFYVRADGGRWVLRYSQPDEVDKYGGSVVLAPTVELKNYREGDLVCVHGQVIEERRVSRTLGGPLYRVNVISMVERGDP